MSDTTQAIHDGRICMVSGDLDLPAGTRPIVVVRRMVDHHTADHAIMRYRIGVDPHEVGGLDLEALARQLARMEPAPRDPSWGVRDIVIGSPPAGTRLQPSEIWSAVDQWLTPHGPPRPVPRGVSWMDAYDPGPDDDLIRDPGSYAA